MRCIGYRRPKKMHGVFYSLSALVPRTTLATLYHSLVYPIITQNIIIRGGILAAGLKNIKTMINETGSRSPCRRPRSDPTKMKNSNVVRSRLIILINEEINEANWMVSNSAKLDRRTKQHTQFGVSASNGSRDMARTKSRRKKRKKKKKLTKRIGW